MSPDGSDMLPTSAIKIVLAADDIFAREHDVAGIIQNLDGNWWFALVDGIRACPANG